MPNADEPMTNEPVPVTSEDTGIASGTDGMTPPEPKDDDVPVEGATGHEAFDKARAAKAEREP